jgi:hypothetical protein
MNPKKVKNKVYFKKKIKATRQLEMAYILMMRKKNRSNPFVISRSI